MSLKKQLPKLKKYVAELVWLFILFYLAFAIMPAFLYKAGQDDLASSIQSKYRFFCHQRVERSLFLFGEEGFMNYYSIEDLQERGALPQSNPNMPEALEHKIFGHPYNGNEEVGYKVALCTRDLGMYFGILITGLIYFLYTYKRGKIVKFDWRFLILLMIPMAVDGTFQLIAEVLGLSWVPYAYFASIGKRYVTGILFGIGFTLLIFPTLKESGQIWYNEGVKKHSESKVDKSTKGKNEKES